jgi:hypothetical protein
MIPGLIVVDNFLPSFEAVRAQGYASPFYDWTGFDGEVYKRIWLGDVPGLQDAIEEHIGPVTMLGMGFRLNYNGEMPNALIHTDAGWGTHALVLYINSGPGGTAFWQHNETGATRISADPVDHELLAKVEPVWNKPDEWSIRHQVSIRKNRAIIYDGSMFHSRFPFEGFGSTPYTGRLIAVAFFTPENPPAEIMGS